MRQQSIKLLSELVDIYSPYFKEDDVMDYVHNWLNSNNIPCGIEEYEDKEVTNFKGKNVVGELDCGIDGPTILFNGHLDTVEICNGWEKNPVKATVEGNRLYGLGSLDMKSGCVSIMLALKNFVEKNKNFRGKIKYQFVSDEEGPFGLGTSALIENGISADVAIVTEPTSGFLGKKGSYVCLGARGGVSYTVKIYGKSAHAATPELGECAITAMSKVITELEKIETKFDDKLGYGSNCIIQSSGGGAACSVADVASFTVFRHIVRGEDKNSVIDEIEDVIKKSGISNRYEINFRKAPSENTECFLPYITDENNIYVNEFLNTLKETDEVNISYFPSIGDFNYLGSLTGIPTIVYGPEGENFHSPDEYVDIDSMVKVTENIEKYLEKMLKI